MFVVLLVGGGLLGYLVSKAISVRDSAGAAGLWAGAAMVVCWLVVVPLAQYIVMRLAGTRPRLGWSPLYPNVFGLLRAVGHSFSRSLFALACALPFFTAWILFPTLATLIPGAWGDVAILVGAAMGVSLYFLWYSILALSKPRGTLIEELEEPGSVRFHEPGVPS